MSDGGFHSVTRLSEARRRLREISEPHRRTDRRDVVDADGRVLAEAPTATRAVPHYERAAMDGYAVRARDTFDASERSPTTLSLAEDQVGTREAVQVHTGTALPDGADAVVKVERTERRDGQLLVYDAVAADENVSPVGEDVSEGQQLFELGHRLSPSDLSLLRSTGRDAVTVVEPPRVSVLPTGDEVVPSGCEPDPGEVVETNGLLVSRLVERWGGDPTYRDVVPDEAASLRNAVEADTDHDVVVTTGGSSVGERDLVAGVVEQAGTVTVHGVAIHPGHPVGFGTVDSTVVLMCPGYPVSCLVTAVQFLRPALAWQEGTEPDSLPRSRGRLVEKLRSEPGRRTFARVRVEEDPAENTPDVEPVRTGGAGVLSSVTSADGWVVIPESREGIPAGETVSVQRWEHGTTLPHSFR
jgi:molybdopterin molybdotransferase